MQPLKRMRRLPWSVVVNKLINRQEFYADIQRNIDGSINSFYGIPEGYWEALPKVIDLEPMRGSDYKLYESWVIRQDFIPYCFVNDHNITIPLKDFKVKYG